MLLLGEANDVWKSIKRSLRNKELPNKIDTQRFEEINEEYTKLIDLYKNSTIYKTGDYLEWCGDLISILSQSFCKSSKYFKYLELKNQGDENSLQKYLNENRHVVPKIENELSIPLLYDLTSRNTSII